MWPLRLRIKEALGPAPLVARPGKQSRFCFRSRPSVRNPARGPSSNGYPAASRSAPDTWRVRSERAPDILRPRRAGPTLFSAGTGRDQCREGGGITDGRTGLMESPASGQWAAERCAPEVVCRARTETGAIGTGGPMEGRAVPRAVAVTGARCAVQGGFLRKGRRGGAPRLSRCGGRGTYESDSSLQSGWSAVLRARGTVPPKACSCSTRVVLRLLADSTW